jgi:hypothetical protein
MPHRDTAPRRTLRQHLTRVAPFLLLGPISGPVMAGVVLNLRDGRPVLAAMYGVLFVELTFLAIPLAAAMWQGMANPAG